MKDLSEKQIDKSLGTRSRWTLFLVAFSLAFLAGLVMLLVGLSATARGPATTPVITFTPVPDSPSVEISPTEGGPGTLLVVTGEGWRPGDELAVHLEAVSGDQEVRVLVALPTVPENGRLMTPFFFPSDERLVGLSRVLVTVRSPVTGDEAMTVLQVVATGHTPVPVVTVTPMFTTTQPTATPEPTSEPTTQPQPSPTAVGCVDRASFVSDVTIADNSRLSPGQSFLKTWRLRNSGTCTWTADYALVFVDGHNMGGPLSVPLRGTVAPGSTVDLSVALIAPAANGTYEGKWQLRNADGKLFGTGSGPDGGVFWVRIIVGSAPTPTPRITNWRGEYFGNRYLTGDPVWVRDDQAISFDWGTAAPALGVPADGFSVRWTRTLSFDGRTYRFYARGDDGVRVWLDGELIIDQWHDASAVTYSVDRTLSAGSHTVRVEYYENGGVAKIQFWWEQVGNFPQWRGEYFSNVTLAGAPALVRNDTAVDFNWGRGAPATGLPADGFSARWTRSLWFEEGLYRFHTVVDDGVRLYVDDALVIDAWSDGGRREVIADRSLGTGNHTVRIEYYERSGDALMQVWWERASQYADWRGEYWSNRSLSGSPVVVRNDRAIDYNWGKGSPAAGLPADDFSIRWTRTANFDAATYRFYALVDDGIRLWVDDRLVLDAWRDGPARELTADYALSQGTHRLRVEYYERTGDARVRVWWDKVTASYADWKGEYWSNRRLRGSPVLVRNDRAIDFQWDAGAPAAGVPADDFSARWTRKVTFEPGLYRLYAWADDGIRVYVDDGLVLDEWHESNGSEVYMIDRALTGKQKLTVEYYEHGGKALVKFWWKRIGNLPTPTPTPTPTSTPKPTVPPPVNGAPVAVDDSAITDEDTRVYINVLINDTDPDGDALTISGYDAASAKGGTVSCTDAGVCAYSPPANFNGSDTFTYVVSDGMGHTDTGTVTIRVNPVNDSPVAVDDSTTTKRNTPVSVDVLANDSDPDGDTLVVSDYQSASAKGGTVGCTNAGVCTYSPPVNFVGDDSFVYTVNDSRGGTDAGTVTVMVYPANRPPVAVDDFATTDEGATVEINVLANDTDPDGDALTVSGYDTVSAKGGAVNCTDAGACTYSPPTAFAGSDMFGYTVSDGNGGSDDAMVTVMVKAAGPVLPSTPTPTPRPTAAPTRTPLPPTATPKPPTATPAPPTATPMPPTPTPRPPTATPVPPTPTPRPPTATPMPSTPTPTPVVVSNGTRINEVSPAPAPMDVDGDGVLDQPDEWIELYNSGSAVANLSGWFLDDGPGGSAPYRIPEGVVLQPGAFMLLYGRGTGIILDDGGDEVRLLRAADGALADAVAFGPMAPNASYSLGGDGVWHSDWPPSPGRPNLPPGSTLAGSGQSEF